MALFIISSVLFFIHLYSCSVDPTILKSWISVSIHFDFYLTVYLSSVAPRGWKVWWYIALCCPRHVRRHVRSIHKEEEVVCAEYQTKRQDVYSGTEGYHVSWDSIFFIFCCSSCLRYPLWLRTVWMYSQTSWLKVVLTCLGLVIRSWPVWGSEGMSRKLYFVFVLDTFLDFWI